MGYETEYDFKEIFKLRDMLDEADIDYVFKDESYEITGTKFTYYHIWCYEDNNTDDNWFISIVQSFGSYGREEDKLEIMRTIN